MRLCCSCFQCTSILPIRTAHGYSNEIGMRAFIAQVVLCSTGKQLLLGKEEEREEKSQRHVEDQPARQCVCAGVDKDAD